MKSKEARGSDLFFRDAVRSEGVKCVTRYGHRLFTDRRRTVAERLLFLGGGYAGGYAGAYAALAAARVRGDADVTSRWCR